MRQTWNRVFAGYERSSMPRVPHGRGYSAEPTASRPLPPATGSLRSSHHLERSITLRIGIRSVRTHGLQLPPFCRGVWMSWKATNAGDLSPVAHIKAGVGETASTPGGLQTNSLVRFVKGKIEIHAGDTIEWSNFDPQEPHTITFGPVPQDIFDPSSNVARDPDGGLSAVLSSPSDKLHSGFLLQALDDQPGTPVNSNPNNSIALNPTHFRVKFMAPGTYNYKCVLHDNLGMVGQVIVVP